MNFAKLTALGLVALTIGSCTYPEFEFDKPAALDGIGGAGAGETMGSRGEIGSQAASGSSSGSTNAAATGAGAGAGAGSGSSASSGGTIICPVTHPGGGECEYLPGKECGCMDGDKCTILEEATGKSRCLDAGNQGPGKLCTSDASCQEGTWCDHFTSTCVKICSSVANCVTGAKCIAAPNGTTGAAIPGLLICTANCEPIKAPQCGTGTTCAFDNSTAVQGFDCFVSGGKTEGAVCAASKECNKGLVCVKGATSTCQRWCTAVDTTFPNASNNCTTARPKCVGFTTPFIRNSVEYGTCVP
jgi:hypothetical protein